MIVAQKYFFLHLNVILEFLEFSNAFLKKSSVFTANTTLYPELLTTASWLNQTTRRRQ